MIFDKVDENNFCFKYLVKEIYKKVWAITKPATTKEQTIKKMSRKSIKGLNFDINDEPELSDYNELTFDELIGNRIKTEKNILYKIAMMTAINDISKANINEKKISTGNDKIKFLNDMSQIKKKVDIFKVF